MEAESVEPDLGVLERVGDVVPCEPFGSCGVAVGNETSIDAGSFVIGEEFGGGRVIDDEIV